MSQFPWMGDPLFTDAWIADIRYLDSSGSVGTVLPQKGTISLVQATGANKPVYSAAFGSQSKGMLTFDGSNDWMSGDALAAKVAGNPAGSFTIIQSFDLLTAVQRVNPWAFSASSDTAPLIEINPATTSLNWQVNNVDDATHTRSGTSATPAVTGKVVLTVGYNGSTSLTDTIRANSVALGAGAITTPSFTATTLTKFTIGALRGATLLNVCNMRWRATVFAPSLLTTQQMLATESFLISEAA